MGKQKRGKKKEVKPVQLHRRTILDGHCTFLAPGPITNSGRADGGWMDRIGITASGLGHIFGPPNALGPIDCFYSNDAYARPGFCTMQLELHPPLEAIGDASTPESLTRYLEDYIHETENNFYQQGNYHHLDDVPRTINDPSSIGSPASVIVQKGFEVPITPGQHIPRDLTATTIAALIHFPNKGNVLFKANNFKRHSPPLDYQEILTSISYTGADPYHGPDPTFSGLKGMAALLESGGDTNKAQAAVARAHATRRGDDAQYCLKCGAHKTPDGGELLGCGKCNAPYCSHECQAADWKRHKRSDCQP